MDELIIRREYPGHNKSIIVDFVAPENTPVMVDPDTPSKAKLATGEIFGFLERPVTEEGPTLADRAGVFPGRLLSPAKKGGLVAVRLADRIEAEGDAFVLHSGTGAITSGTAIYTKLSFVDGKFREKQASDRHCYTLIDKPTPKTQGKVRILAERVM